MSNRIDATFRGFLFFLMVSSGAIAKPFHESLLIEPLNELHDHGSCVIELPNGDVLATWYKGHGERKADDVRIVGARLRKGEKMWSEVFEVADFEGFPDCNVCSIIDAEGKLWIFWPLIVANQWETAILMARYSTHYAGPGPPAWDWQQPIILKPGDRFQEMVKKEVEDLKKTLPENTPVRHIEYLNRREEKAGDKYFRRAGWMPRPHPTILPTGRILLPLYSDGFDFSIVAISDNHGKTWRASSPILSLGGVQPSIVRKKDGTLVAYMRDNGPPPKRVLYSISKDEGETWTEGKDHELHNSGAGLEAIRLQSGAWIMANNDLEQGRHRLAIHYSDDEGETWSLTRYLEEAEPGEGGFGYPSIFQGADGKIHSTYTYNRKADGPGSAIKYACFNEAWVTQGQDEE